MKEILDVVVIKGEYVAPMRCKWRRSSTRNAVVCEAPGCGGVYELDENGLAIVGVLRIDPNKVGGIERPYAPDARCIFDPPETRKE